MSLTILQSVSELCERAGLSSDQYDVTGLASISQPVNSLVISQVTSARNVLEMLSSAYFFDIVLSDKIYFVARGGSTILDVPYTDMGTIQEREGDRDPLPLSQSGELEVPAQIALTYYNIDSDYEPDTQYSDRLFTGQESTSTVQLPMSFTPTEAKQIVDRMLADQAWRLKATIALDLRYTKLEPSDTINLISEEGVGYRVRILTREESEGVITFDTVVDDASIAVQYGITTGSNTSQTQVFSTPITTLKVLDVPMLSYAEDTTGVYIAVNGSSALWGSAGIYKSKDNITFNLIDTISDQAAIGTVTSIPGTWSDFNLFDNTSTITVNIGSTQQLSNYTINDILIGIAPAYLIGNEIVYAQVAELLSLGVYNLRGLLRARGGTEQYVSSHVIGEKFVELSTSGIRFIPLSITELGSTIYFKGVSSGQEVDSATSISIIPLGNTMKPYSPVLAKIDRTTSDHLITWTRRTRVPASFTGSLPMSTPLGETVEKYIIEIYAGSSQAIAGTPIIRTIETFSNSATYTSAQRTTDGTGSVIVHMRVYQVSSVVGKGTPLIISI